MVDLFTEISNTIENMTKYDRFRKLCDAAHWMEIFCDNVISVSSVDPLPTQADGVLTIQLEPASGFTGKAQAIFTAMCRLSDQSYFSTRENGVVRITLTVQSAYNS